MNLSNYDVVIVGASISGCAAAIMYAQTGLRVALLESRRSISAHKVLCTHHLQPCGVPILDRIGVKQTLLEKGMVTTVPQFWTEWGWIKPPHSESEPVPNGFNVRRETLDPVLRSAAADTANVDLLLGHKVIGLLTRNGQVGGVYGTAEGKDFAIQSTLTVGADGKDSAVARAAQVKSKTTENGRFSYFAHLKDIDRPLNDATLSWFMNPDVAYLMPNDGGITLLAIIPAIEKLPAFKEDLTSAYLDYVNALPGAPTIARENLAGKITGTTHYPLMTREPVGKGFALIGDAASINDPLWGIGCAWALQTAEYLVDATASAFGADTDMAAALSQYKKKRATMVSHMRLMYGYAGGRKFNPIERLVYSAAARNPSEARRFHLFGSRLISPGQYLSPLSLAGAATINLRHMLGRESSSAHAGRSAPAIA